MQVSIKVFLVLSLATLMMFILDHYYNQGHLELLLLLVLGGLPAITRCNWEGRLDDKTG